MSKKFSQLFWVDAIGDLARRVEMPAAMERKYSSPSTILYVLPGPLAKVCRVYWSTAGRYKCQVPSFAMDNKDPESLCRYLGNVDLSVAMSAFETAKASTTIRALSHPYDTTKEIDILCIEPAYLADPEAPVHEHQQHRVVPRPSALRA